MKVYQNSPLGWLQCWIKQGHTYKFKRSLKVTMVFECGYCGFYKIRHYFRGVS